MQVTTDQRKSLTKALELLTPFCPAAPVTKSSKPAFILCGGSAMYAYGFRERISDLDVYCKQQGVYDRWVIHGDSDVDLTNDTHFFGELNIGDADRDAAANLIEDGEHYKVSALSLETIFIQKTNAGRDKDIADLRLIRDYVEPMHVLARMADLKKYNDYTSWYMAAENLLAEVQMQYQLPVTLEMIQALNMNNDDQETLCATFGIDNPRMETSKRYKRGMSA